MKRVPLHVWIVIGLLGGAVAGLAVNAIWTGEAWQNVGVGDAGAFMAGRSVEANEGAGAGAWVVKAVAQGTEFVGQLFVRLLRFVAVPIVLFSLIVGVASLGDVRRLGRIGGKTLVLFVVTTAISATIGLTLSNAVRPGRFVDEAKARELSASQASAAQARIEAGEKVRQEVSIWGELSKIVPLNPFESLAKAEMLQVVFLATVIGVGLTLVPRGKSEAVVRLCDGMQEAIGSILRGVMYLAPVAVFALIAVTISRLGLDVLGALLVYCVVVVVGLSVSQFVMYPGLLWVLTRGRARVTPGRFLSAMSPAMLLAFSSSSSNATLPVTMECARDRLGVAEEIVSFVCPLGATVNMAGTALYQAVAATFLAQVFGIDLSLSQQVMIVGLATLIAVGSPGVPGGSIVMMVIVLEAIHVPPQGIAIILAVDRILDMCRTVVNISGDAAVAAMVGASEGKLATAAEVASRGPTK
jgi:proton glutamate symport protein